MKGEFNIKDGEILEIYKNKNTALKAAKEIRETERYGMSLGYPGRFIRVKPYQGKYAIIAWEERYS